MSLRRLFSTSPYLALSFALLASLLSVIPVQEAKAAAVPITTYPQQKTAELIETQTITSASYASSNITFTTSRKNLFAFEKPLSGPNGMHVQITGMVSTGASCDKTWFGEGNVRNDGYNTPVDSITVTSIEVASPGVVRYNVGWVGELIAGDDIIITGATGSAGFNGEFKINTVVDTSSSNRYFTVLNDSTGASSRASARHIRWERLIGVTDTTFTIARNPGSSCVATTTSASLVVAREFGGPTATYQEKSTNMATDATGSLIFMSTGATYPTDSAKLGNLYISRNSGVTWKKVDLSDGAGVSLGNTPIPNRNTQSSQYQFEQLTGCQHRVCAWSAVAASQDGQTLAAASFEGELVFSRDGGTSWTEVYREKQKRCYDDGQGVSWNDVRLSEDGSKLIAYDFRQSNLLTLDLTKPYSFDLQAKLPTNLSTDHGFPACAQSVYTTLTNPSIYGAFSSVADEARMPAEIKDVTNVHAFAINKAGTRLLMITLNGSPVICDGTGTQWTKCSRPAPPKYQDSQTPQNGWASIDVRAAFMSANGRYITLGGFMNIVLRSTDYGVNFEVVSNAGRGATNVGTSNASISACGDPNGINSIAGSDDGKVQYFVTRRTQYAVYLPSNIQATTPGICRSSNYGAKGSWTSVPVALFPGSNIDISRKQLFTSVVVGATGYPVYFGSTGVNLGEEGTTCSANRTLCLPNFWSSFSITGAPAIGTPVGVPITEQIYSTVNPPTKGKMAISWGIGRTSNGSSVPGITISATGLVAVSGSVPIGSYPMTITATDDGTLTTLEMAIYVYDVTRPIPTFDTPVRQANGYTVNITNYDSNYFYFPISDTGTVAVGAASGSILPLTLTGIAESTSAIISVDSFMGTYETDLFGLKVGTVTGISKWTQAALTFATSPFIGSGGSRTLSTSGGSGTGAVTYVATAGSANCSITSVNVLSVPGTATAGNTCVLTATKAEDANYVARSSSPTTFTVRLLGRIPTFGTPIRTSGGFIVAITNYDAAYTWNIRVSNGSVAVGTPVGSIETLTVTSLSPGGSATISVGTTRTSYSDETGTVLSYAISNLTITASDFSTTVGVARTARFSLAGLTGSDSVTAVTYRYQGTNGTTYADSPTPPTAVGEYIVTPSVGVFGSGSASNYTISYVSGLFSINSALVVGGGSNISATFLTPTTSDPFTVTGGTGVIRFRITGALAGVSIDSVTGVVFVTSASPITSISVSVIATDEVGATDSEPITIEVTLGGGTLIVLTFPTAGAYPTKKATAVLIRATVATVGRVTFTANKRKIPGCSNVRTVNFVATCNWKPTSHGVIDVVATIDPDDVNLLPASVKVPTTPTQRTTPRQ